MRKREREVTDEQTIREILEKSKVLHLGLADADMPYVVPMNYGYIYENGKLTLYMHGATEGYKYEVIRRNPKVSFAMECDVVPFEGKMPCQYGTSYAGIMGQGKAAIVENVDEKIQALTVLMKTQTGKDFVFNEKLVSIVSVIRVDVETFSAKKRPFPGEM